MAFVNQNPILQSLIAEQLVSDPSSARGRLLNEAARLFRDKGYERTTVRDLAAAVGIQSGSLFHHFRTKEEILKAVMVETIRLNTALMQAAADQADSAREKLRALIRAELESINGQTGEAMAVLVYEWRSLSESSQAEVLELRDIYENLWLSTLQQLSKEHQLGADPFITRRMLTGALSWTVTWYRPERGGLTLDGLTDQVMAMLGLAQC
ncbi:MULTISPECIES: TetR/AcrR family transcriptional regulator [Marinobacter]|jgi:AcrR family transcriptional regulator|uniref:TetR family transcriptional regulator n=2 Tax=Marinobacter nauticus TaxID=2743 RepID=A0A368UY13_MARNT|nr:MULTISPECIES: TetR/AcrR family transcriptional regulator [Marinobacter]ABM19876.1 transcriptional regulator, TetR family [Marinobacter nauticus VT8]ERS09921.1 TetR family transcriptional regulator [Marinobacter sp. EN3]ERS89758.1 TetR family transcriptional regulator [Marinobacter sp. C1S70]RBP72556.1 TetR family transcriptional regulator [Marinobacter nauticus]RCW33483.1 TetR family transcriptional regulator [Marinobacter nauticus]